MLCLKRCSLGLGLFCLLLTGCWDRTELNELAITSASALDLDKDKWVLSFQVIIPSAISGAMGNGEGATTSVPVVVHSTVADTIKDAVSQSYLEAPRKLYFGHTSILVIGEQAAKKGFSQIIDLYLRNADSRETVTVLIASGDGRSILEQLTSMDPIPGQGIQRIVEKENRYVSALPNVRMFELTKQMLSPSKSALLPEVIVSGGKKVTGTDQLKQTTMPSKLRMGRAAIIKKDKLIGWMNEKEAMGTAFLSNKVNSGTIPFSACEEQHGPSDKDSTFLVSSSSTKTSIKENNGVYAITSHIKVHGRLNETGCSLDLIKPEVIAKMEQNIAKEIKQMALKAWAAIQKSDADVAGFYNLINRKYPSKWKEEEKEGESVLKKIKLKVQVEVQLERVGLSNKSYRMLMED